MKSTQNLFQSLFFYVTLHLSSKNFSFQNHHHHKKSNFSIQNFWEKKLCPLLILRLVRGLSKTGKVTEETYLMYFKEYEKIPKRINI